MTATSLNIAAQLESIVGRSQTKSSPQECTPYAVNEIVPSAVATPASAEQVAEIVRFAAKENLAVIPCGSRSKLNIGMPPSRYDIAVDMTSINQIAHYDPADLTLSVDAGMSLASLASVLLQHKQFLPLSVPFADRTTVGGTVASGIDSPLRQLYGTARDFIIGAEFVNGTGALTKSGGRVVKNVTGYDLHKLLVGSLGTLAVITRINFRTFPLPLNTLGFVASFSSATQALAFRDRIADSPLSLSTFEILSPGFPELFPNSDLWQVCIGFAGTPEVCERVSRDIASYAAGSNSTSTTILEDQACFILWQQVREAIPHLLSASPATCIFKISQSPSGLNALFASLEKINLPIAILSRSSGTFYCAVPNNSAAHIFQICSEQKATASLLWCPTELKKTLNVWGPVQPDRQLMQRLKLAFDPQNILSPSRY
jgi:glycolate oxidase FAD binding subunit